MHKKHNSHTLSQPLAIARRERYLIGYTILCKNDIKLKKKDRVMVNEVIGSAL